MLALVISLKNVVLCLKLTVLEQVRYLATLKGMDTKEIKEKLPQWMEKLEVKGKLTDKIKSLSKESTEDSIDYYSDS